MSYRTPTPHEIRMSAVMKKAVKKIDRLLTTLSGGECDFIICVSSKSERKTHAVTDLQDAPVGNYAATMNRESSALMMLELMAKWRANEEMPPIHDLRDANGRTLSEILGEGPH